jgi:hypothetical protein
VLNLYPKSVAQDKTQKIVSVGHGNPKGCKKVAEVAGEAQTPRKRRRRIRTLKGCRTDSVTLSGSENLNIRSRGYRAARSTPGYFLAALQAALSFPR